MKFFRLIWKNVFRKKTRTFLTMGSIVMVLVLIVILTSLLKALSYDQNAGGNRIVVQHATGLANFMPLAYRQRIEQIPGVVAVAPEIWFGGVYKDDKPENFFGQLSTDPEAWPKIFDDYKIPDDQVKAWQAERDSFIAGKELANRYHWKIGIASRSAGPTSRWASTSSCAASTPRSTRPTSSSTTSTRELVARNSGQTGIFIWRANTATTWRRSAARSTRCSRTPRRRRAMSEKQFQPQFTEMGNVVSSGP
jgi:hypothetical protein